MEKLSIPKKDWLGKDENQKEEIVTKVFDHYRERGFPFFSLDKDILLKELAKTQKFLSGNPQLISNYAVKQTMHALSICWAFHPHAYSVRCNGKISPLEAFSDDDIFKNVIRKRMKMGDNISDSGIRKMLKIFTGVQGVSNFRPTAAWAIYEHFLPKHGVVVDMSMGYGGRFLGSSLSNSVSAYFGFEPCRETFHGNIKMRDFLLPYVHNESHFYSCGSEFYQPGIEGCADLCFTSPPYFDTERYSVENSQSYIKYPTKELWIEGFLGQTFKNCHLYLKDSGRMVINIANVPSFQNLESECVHVARASGFELDKTYFLALSSLSHKSKYKMEPIFVFKKF